MRKNSFFFLFGGDDRIADELANFVPAFPFELSFCSAPTLRVAVFPCSNPLSSARDT